MAHPKLLAMVLAGGKGERLFPLTVMRSKPAVPFGGKYRIIDFVLSNLVNSNIYSAYLLVQYKSQSLIEHIRKNWVFSPLMAQHFITAVPPQMRMGPEWFQGTADAVFQNMNLIMDHSPELVIVFGADHLYRMDIRQMVDFHLEKGAEVTVAARPVPLREASAFGVIAVDQEQTITEFLEKPKSPPHMPGRPHHAFVSMGNYIFNRDVLLDALSRAQRMKRHDFGAHILPDLVRAKKSVFAYDFHKNVIPGVRPHEEQGYWRDVGTIESFFNAHMDMLGAKPKIDLDNRHWPVHAGTHQGASTRVIKGDIRNSLIAEGAVINGAKIRNSIIGSGVTIEADTVVEDCIVMEDVNIGRGCALKRLIIDKRNVVEDGEKIGLDPEADRFRCHIDRSGIAVLPRGGRVKRARPR